jgi:uncharacterized membrane protein YkoI
MKHSSSIAIALLTATTAVSAWATDLSDIRALDEAELTLMQAIELAEEHEGGEAIDASIDDDAFVPTFEVSVLREGRIYEVYINGVDGTVLGSRVDIDD